MDLLWTNYGDKSTKSSICINTTFEIDPSKLFYTKKGDSFQNLLLDFVAQTEQISNHFLEDLERLISLSAKSTVVEY